MSANHRLWHMKSDKCATKSVRLLLRCSCEGDIQCSQMSHDYRSHTIFAMLSVRTTDAWAELITRIATASLSECQQRGIGWPGGRLFFCVRGATTCPRRPAGDNGLHVNEIFINADLFIGKKISAGGPSRDHTHMPACRHFTRKLFNKTSKQHDSNTYK